MKARARSLLLISLLFVGTSARAEDWWKGTGENRNFKEAPVIAPIEPSQVVLPPYPKPENLVEYDIGPTAWNRAYVDASAISVGSDQIVRYVLVIKTPGGATNVSFEGIRCSEWERLAYAYGQSDGTWVRSRQPEWRHIPKSDNLGYYRELAKNLFCEVGLPAGTAAELTVKLKKLAPRGRD
jgi:hypothetical protein